MTPESSASASAVNGLHVGQAVGTVCRWVEDVGGVFSGLNARTAQAKFGAVLNEPEDRAVLGWRASSATKDWPDGSAHEAIQPIARRVARRIGLLMPDTAVLFTARLLVDLGGSHPEHLSPAEARNVKARIGR